MSDLISSLKSEIVRLSRKEAKAAVDPVRKPSIAARKAIADIKRRMAALEKELRRVNEVLSKVQSAQPCQPEPAASDVKVRITSRNVRGLRNRLKLAPAAFAKLLDVTPKWVYLYENKEGPLKMRATTLKAFLAATALKAGEAKRRVSAMK
jgi:DNA-binding transcriptional regulator YiaG